MKTQLPEVPLMFIQDIEPSQDTTWDDPLNQKLTGTITLDQLDKIYYQAILELNSTRLEHGNKAPLAKEIERLYHIAYMACQKVS